MRCRIGAQNLRPDARIYFINLLIYSSWQMSKRTKYKIHILKEKKAQREYSNIWRELTSVRRAGPNA